MTPSILGLTFHQATISAAVSDSTGKLVMESILETKASAVLQLLDFVQHLQLIPFFGVQLDSLQSHCSFRSG